MVKQMYGLIKRLTNIIEVKTEVRNHEAAGVKKLETRKINHGQQQQ